MPSTVAFTRRTSLGLLAAGFAGNRARPETLQPLSLGLLRTLSPAPFYIAKERGYFAENGINLTFRFFQAAQPIAAAAVAADIDVGVTALTGGFFNLAEKGTLTIIGGAMHEEKGYDGSAIIVSDAAFKAGLTSPAKLAGHSFAITQYGSSFHYMLGQIAEVEKFDHKTVSLRPVQQVPNMLAAVETGQVDATIAIASQAKPAAAAGKVHIIGWIGEIVPYQITAVFTTPKMITQHADALHRFCRAYQKGVADYREAFLRLDAQGKPITGPDTDAVLPLIQKYVFTGDPHAREKILAGVGYYDAGGALDVADITRQLRWFRAQGLVQGDEDAAALMDAHFLPTR
jgi:NitT/TauT family transport system substrate-binding protein